MANKTSIVIPSRNEQFLEETIRDLLRNARGEIEIIPVLEGYWPDEMVTDPRVHYLHFTTPRGMRGAINAGAAVARGKYLMKCDGHCSFDEGFDVKLAQDLEPNWISVPTRYSLIPETWERKQKKPIDYMFLCAPTDPNDFGGPSLHGKEWGAKQNDPTLKDIRVDDLMSAQGSCWFMHRDYFHELELEDAENYGDFCFEFQEIGLKCWLSGGRVIRNKNTWYAHLHKGKKFGRGWPLATGTLKKGAAFTNHWMDRQNWHKQDRDIRWLINKFWPVPTWSDESVRFVFHRRHGGSGEIRGSQMAQRFLARINPTTGWAYDFDIHIWVKMQPADLTLPGKHYLDILDEPRRIPWLLKHPECGVIASSQSGLEYLKKALSRDDILLIPQHHCNYERFHRPEREIKVAGVVGGTGALQYDVDDLRKQLKAIGIELRIENDYTTREEVAEFYKGLDVQLVWRTQQRPLKNPLKLVNAMSFGIPTIAYPEIAYQEVEGFYWPVTEPSEIVTTIDELQQGFDAQRLIDKAEEYHIDNIAKLYRGLL